jgi:hypothetical protein
MSKETKIDAVGLVRGIRDDIYKQTKEMSAAELVEFFRRHSASAKERIARGELRHEIAARTRE